MVNEEKARAVSFCIPYPPTKAAKSAWNKRFSLNAYYAGKHYHARKKDAEDLHAIAISAMKRARVKRELFQSQVSILFYWDDGLDCDNHAVIGKAIVDAMKGYIIKDDSRRYVRKVSHEFWDGGEIRVEVVP